MGELTLLALTRAPSSLWHYASDATRRCREALAGGQWRVTELGNYESNNLAYLHSAQCILHSPSDAGGRCGVDRVIRNGAGKRESAVGNSGRPSCGRDPDHERPPVGNPTGV